MRKTMAALLVITSCFFGLMQGLVWACACGCGVFDVGTSSMFPGNAGGTAFLEYDYQDQNRNWRGSSRASADDNNDKDLRTHFVTAGFQYMFDRSWGVQVEVPYVNRTFKSADPDTGGITKSNWGDLGDVRVRGIYTGFSPDMSTGVNFGLKLPTGNYTHKGVDRDTQFGTGSTDILLGGYHRGSITSDNAWGWFTQAQVNLPVFIRDRYRPGTEFDEALGVNYGNWSIGSVKIIPIAQVIGSQKTRDTGANAAHPVASGYNRILLSPGLEINIHPVMIYADVEFPVYQHFTGNQLAAHTLFKTVISYKF